MADIELNVEVRDRTGTGGARAARREGKVPGVLYGGPRGPVPIAASENAFRKALYTGKLRGHLVTLKYGDETQPVIARDVQFDPVSDRPVHFDLFRVEAHQLVKIAVPVHFTHQDECRGLKRGGTLNIARHEVELWAPADEIPEELTIDLKGYDVGDAVRWSAVKVAASIEPVISDRDFVIATIAGTSAMASMDAAVDHAVAEAQAAAAEAGSDVDTAAVAAAAQAAVEAAAASGQNADTAALAATAGAAPSAPDTAEGVAEEQAEQVPADNG